MKLLVIIQLILTTQVFAGWKIYYVPEKVDGDRIFPERVTMGYFDKDEGHDTLDAALAVIKAQGKLAKLDFIRPNVLTHDPKFQEELIQAFKVIAPENWNEAKRSSGHMHNKKTRALIKHLSKAFIRTSLAQSITKDLKRYNLYISKFGQEKLSFENIDDQRKIRGIFHVNITSLVSDKFFYLEVFSLRSFNFDFESSIDNSISSPQSFLCF